MATDTYPAELGEVRAASTADGGTALTTTAVVVALHPGTRRVWLEARNYSTAVVVKFALNPWLVCLRVTDASAADWTALDVSDSAQDASTATTCGFSSQGTGAQSAYYFIGSHYPFRGVAVDIQATNSTANTTLTVKYWNGAWTDITASDGTAAAGVSFAQDGQVTWTVPSDWTRATLRTTMSSTLPAASVVHQRDELYWTRWEFDEVLDASVTANSLLALARNTSYAEIKLDTTTGGAGTPMHFAVTRGKYGVGCIEALTNAGTANLIVNCAAAPNDAFSN